MASVHQMPSCFPFGQHDLFLITESCNLDYISWLREAKTYFFYPTYGSRMMSKKVRLRVGTRMGSQNNTYFGCKNTVFLRKNQIK